MLFFPSRAVRCPDCGGLLFNRRIQSGNTFGATLWTDSKCEAPHFPNLPDVVACPHCAVPLWPSDEPVVCLETDYRAWQALAGLKPARELDPIGYRDALRRCCGRRRREAYVRVRLWWLGNDVRREGCDPPGLTDAEVTNIKALARVLRHGVDEERLLKAEVLRELGHFDEAEKLLSAPFDEDLLPAVERIRELVAEGESRVARY